MISILFSLAIFVLVAGLIYWLAQLLPIPQPFKNVVLVIFIVICILVLLSWLGGWMPAPWMRA